MTLRTESRKERLKSVHRFLTFGQIGPIMIYHLPDASRNSPRIAMSVGPPAAHRGLARDSHSRSGEGGDHESRHNRTVSIGACLWLSAAGCTTPMVARYIYQDGEFGVVGIPVNNYQKRVDFRAQAEALMARHFPEGYEIVRAEEVNEGERIRDVGRKTEFEAEPAVAVLNQIIRLGSLNRTTSFAEKDKLQVRECRIIYKKKSIHTPGRTGQFASATSLAPPLYIDPNEILRHQIKTSAELLARADASAKKPGGSPVQERRRRQAGVSRVRTCESRPADSHADEFVF